MGRKPRNISSTGFYHIILRGNNKRHLFHEASDFESFLDLLIKYFEKSSIKLHHYCLMTNHVHLLLWSENPDNLSKAMHGLARSFHHFYRKKYSFFGHLFQGRYRSLIIEEDGHLLDCGRYIEKNPVRAHMVKKAEDWKYSSYRHYAFGEKNDFISLSQVYQALSQDEKRRQRIYRTRIEGVRPYEKIIDKALLGD
jgi:putative transposase